jgi:tetratricopeptide (TPR) repeat protein
MSNASAKQLLEQAMELTNQGQIEEAISIYQQIIGIAPEWATPHYNLGLLYKYENAWELSYRHNQKAVLLDSSDDSAWWNLGIAATVLLDWRTAREAWNKFGLNLEVNDEELNLDLGRVPIRVNPDDAGEVVWCERIDPARTIIQNIPLASSGHRYGDLLLNDGAAQGYRISNGQEVPVFNELQVLKQSEYKTYSITAYFGSKDDIDKLAELCSGGDIEMENWSTLRYLCKQCSEGTPHETHDNELKTINDNERYIGFASLSESALKQVLENWRILTSCNHTELKLELDTE